MSAVLAHREGSLAVVRYPTGNDMPAREAPIPREEVPLTPKALVKHAVERLGYDIVKRTTPPYKPGRSSLEDMSRFVTSETPVIFDVGANVGQTIERFRGRFAESTIHAFEPSPETFETLKERTAGIERLHLTNAGMGAHAESKTFVVNRISQMSSFLELGPEAFGATTSEIAATLDTIDEYCDRVGVDHIDIFKTDTQGYELEVLRGAGKMLERKKIRLVYVEMIFSDMYHGLPGMDEVFKFLFDRGLRIVSFYDMGYQNGLLGWMNVLLVDPAYRVD